MRRLKIDTAGWHFVTHPEFAIVSILFHHSRNVTEMTLQAVLSISKISIAINLQKIIYRIIMPLVKDIERTLKKLYGIPQK